LRDLPPEQDLVGARALVREAGLLSDITPAARQRIRARLRSALVMTGRRTRWRMRLHPILVLVAALISASVGGAAVQSMIAQRRQQRGAVDGESGHPPGRAEEGRPRRGRRAAATVAPAAASPSPTPSPSLELSPPLPTPSPSLDPLPPTAPARAIVPAPRGPSVSEAKATPAVAGPSARAIGLEPPPLEVAPAPPAEAALLAGAIRALRGAGEADVALALLDEHGARFPNGAMTLEAGAVRIEALLKAGRTAAALAALDRFPLDDAPGRDEWQVVRGELRANAGRWREAETDFAAALTGRLDDARGDLAERALWARAGARARRGDAVGARADYMLYLERFAAGRFADQARSAVSPQMPVKPRAP
jgi:hypothetical protein